MQLLLKYYDLILLAAHIMIGLQLTMKLNLLPSVKNGQQQLCQCIELLYLISYVVTN